MANPLTFDDLAGPAQPGMPAASGPLTFDDLKPVAAASGAQSSLYDPATPVLSDDPRYWPPQQIEKPWYKTLWEYGPFSSKAPGPERGTFVPLAAEKGKKPELAVPGIVYDPIAASQDILKEGQRGVPSDPTMRELAPEGMAAAAITAPDAGIGSRVLPAPATVGRFSATVQGAAEKRAARAALANDKATNPDNPPDSILDKQQQQINRGKSQGQDPRLLDVGGEPARNEARRSRGVSEEAGQKLGSFLQSRSEGQSTRAETWLRTRLGNPEEAGEAIETIKENAKDPKSNAYQAAYKAGQADPGFWTWVIKLTPNGPVRTRVSTTPGGITVPPTMDPLLRNDGILKFAEEATRRYERSRAAGLVVQNDVELTPITKRGKTPRTIMPTGLPLEWWDQFVRVLGDAIESTKKSSPYDSRALTVIRKQFVDMLDAAIPEYKTARGIAAEAFNAIDSVEAGENIAKGRYLVSEIEAVRNKTPKPEWGRVQVGFWTEYLRDITFLGRRKDIVKNLVESEGERRKVAAVLGDDVARDLELMLYVEHLMETSKNTITTGTQTAEKLERLRTRGLLPSTVAAGVTSALTSTWHGVLVGALIYGLRQVELNFRIRVAERTADLLLSDNAADIAKGFKQARPFLPNMRQYIKATPMLAADLPNNPDDLQIGNSYRNKTGQLGIWNGEHFETLDAK